LKPGRSRIAWIVFVGLVVLAVLDTAIALFLPYYGELMRTNTGPMDWSVPVFLGILLTFVFFPYTRIRTLPRGPAVIVAAIAIASSVFVVLAYQPPIARHHISVLLALCAFGVAGTLKAMGWAAAMRKPTEDEVANAVVGFAIEAAVTVVFGAAGAVVSHVAENVDIDFTPGGGAFGGGGATGSW
jgi:hypothetical protein